MAVSEEHWLPTVDDITVPELEVSTPVLRAAAFHLGKWCDNECKEFMLCSRETEDPRRCIKEGKETTQCAFRFFGLVKRHCYDDFTNYWKCLDHSGRFMEFNGCRKTQAKFDACVKEHLHQDRPAIGHFSRTRLHTSPRPPGEQLKPQILPERLPELIPDPNEPVSERFKDKTSFS